MTAQYIANGILIGGLYACLAVGFALVWGVLNIVNMIHGTFVVIGAYLTMVAAEQFGIPPYAAAPLAGILLYIFGYAIQRGLINKVVGQPILITLTLTFGIDLLLGNILMNVFSATPRSLVLNYGNVAIGGVQFPIARLGAMVLAIVLTLALYWLLKHSSIGRAIIAVRMDRHAAALMGIRIPHIYAMTFGIGALMAGVAGAAIAVVYPITPVMSGMFLGKVFVICVLGGLGSVPGAIVGGLALGLAESFGAFVLGNQWATTVGFMLMIVVLVITPNGLAGKRGFE